MWHRWFQCLAGNIAVLFATWWRRSAAISNFTLSSSSAFTCIVFVFRFLSIVVQLCSFAIKSYFEYEPYQCGSQIILYRCVRIFQLQYSSSVSLLLTPRHAKTDWIGLATIVMLLLFLFSVRLLMPWRNMKPSVRISETKNPTGASVYLKRFPFGRQSGSKHCVAFFFFPFSFSVIFSSVVGLAVDVACLLNKPFYTGLGWHGNIVKAVTMYFHINALCLLYGFV